MDEIILNDANTDIQISDYGIEVLEAQERASIDMQVATAKRFPRDLRKVLDNSIVVATIDKKTSEKCRYAKPTGGKIMNGPSVYLARIIGQQYKNLRVQQRIKNIENRTIVAEAVAIDLENNYAVCVEVRRSIIDSHGQRYSDSLIETNAMAAMAIAERNAILKIVPPSITEAVYNNVVTAITGDLSKKAIFLKEREDVFKTFKNVYGMAEEQVLKSVGLHTKEAIKSEDLLNLKGFIQALENRELTVEELLTTRNTAKSAKSAQDIADKKKDMKNNVKQSEIPMP